MRAHLLPLTPAPAPPRAMQHAAFWEGCITAGLSTDAADDAVQADIVNARYGA